VVPSPNTPIWLTHVDHTGDAGISVNAADCRELFARAAWGMFSLITNMEAIRLAEMSRVQIAADDFSALMVKWLSELNYRHVTEHRLFGQFKVVEMDDATLLAEVRGERFDPTRHEIFTEIKAVTFHGLRLEHDDNGWKAQIIFDL
jgi:SHS2 domain-containing protein